VISELPVNFLCQGNWLYGILHKPAKINRRGVLIVVGGPQYRVGSHRQFVLLARRLCQENIPVLRFDYTGMGDSEGEQKIFEDLKMDIQKATDTFIELTPGLEEIVIWGLCDAASAALMYICSDDRIKGVVLLNPWVRTETGISRAYLKCYYLKRIVDPNLWKKILAGKFNFISALGSFFEMIISSFGKDGQRLERNGEDSSQQSSKSNGQENRSVAISFSYIERMYQGLKAYKGRVLIILSGDDLTAREFKDMVATTRKWKKLLDKKNTSRFNLIEANHTFSRKIWRKQVEDWTLGWVNSW